MKKLLVASTLLSIAAQPSFADQYLIDEMESLKKTLKKEDPDRLELTLRLADLYFDVSIQEGNGPEVLEKRNKAARLYESVLYAKDGLPKISSKEAIKVKFQLARVYNKLSKIHEAAKLYTEVYSDKDSYKKIKRESAFALAEYYEEVVNFKQANQFYKNALELAQTKESKNYAHYKRAWLLYKEVMIDEAIAELKLSLFDSKNQVREKVLNDLFLFFSSRVTDGKDELAYIKDLSQKINDKTLVRTLVESFYGAGNRLAGSTVLEHLNKTKPDLFYELRLMEEFYGFRNIEKVQKYLSMIQKRSIKDLPQKKEEAKEFKSMFKRVLVQFDAEIKVDEGYRSILLETIDSYFSLYPNDEMRKKLQQGWLSAQKDEIAKIDRLKQWIIQDIDYGVDTEHIRKMRQTRLSLAQKHKKSQIIIEEAGAIAQIYAADTKAREFEYIKARELYRIEEYEQALPLFVKLADLKITYDKWSILSQNLALDIYNKNNDYTSIVSQADSWLSNLDIVSKKELIKDIADMKLVRKQADFQNVVALGESEAAKNKFFDYCFKNIYPKKSCSNAKVLAVKLKDQEKLVSLLEREGDEKALVTEYELMGRFSDSARLQEKFDLKRNSSLDTYLKIALLYEVDTNFKDRDRILKKMIAKIKRDKKIPADYEALLYKTFEQANMIDRKILFLPWSTQRKITIAHTLEQVSPHKKSYQIIAKQNKYAGPIWAKMVLSKAKKLYDKQAKISFYGRSSQYKFKRRINALDKFAKYSKGFLEGADLDTRVYMLSLLEKAYTNLSAEILSTPLPEGLTEEVLMQVQAQLTQMASPYSQVAADYARLMQEQFSMYKEPDKLAAIQSNLASNNTDYASFITIEKIEINNFGNLDYSEAEILKEKLQKYPNDKQVLSSLKDFYEANGQLRQAAYFTGRIKNLEEQI